MTHDGSLTEWVVVLTKQGPQGQWWELATYGFSTEQEATQAVAGLLLKHRDRGYLSGTVRRRGEHEAGVGVRR